MVRERFAKPSVALKAWRFPKGLGFAVASPLLSASVDGYRNGYNGADLKSDVAKALWVRILHHPPICSSIPILAEEMASDTIKYRFESSQEHQKTSMRSGSSG